MCALFGYQMIAHFSKKKQENINGLLSWSLQHKVFIGFYFLFKSFLSILCCKSIKGNKYRLQTCINSALCYHISNKFVKYKKQKLLKKRYASLTHWCLAVVTATVVTWRDNCYNRKRSSNCENKHATKVDTKHVHLRLSRWIHLPIHMCTLWKEKEEFL